MKPRCECIFYKKKSDFFLVILSSSYPPHFEKDRPVFWLTSLFRKQSFSLQWIAITASLIATQRRDSFCLFCSDANKKLETQKRVKVTVPSPMPLLSKCVTNCDVQTCVITGQSPSCAMASFVHQHFVNSARQAALAWLQIIKKLPFV